MDKNNSSDNGRTLKQIQKEIDLERERIKNRKNEIRLKKEKFLQENSSMRIFCKNCNKEYNVSEYVLIFRNRRKTPEFQCKACKRERNRQQMLKGIIERGY